MSNYTAIISIQYSIVWRVNSAHPRSAFGFRVQFLPPTPRAKINGASPSKLRAIFRQIVLHDTA